MAAEIQLLQKMGLLSAAPLSAHPISVLFLQVCYSCIHVLPRASFLELICTNRQKVCDPELCFQTHGQDLGAGSWCRLWLSGHLGVGDVLGGAALPITCHHGMSQLSLAGLGSTRLQPPSWELADITPGKGGSRWDIAVALPTAKLNIKHLAEGSGVLAAQEVCHGGTAK